MTGVFYMPLWWHWGGTDTEQESAHKVNSGEENSPARIRTPNLLIMITNKLSRLCRRLPRNRRKCQFLSQLISVYWNGGQGCLMSPSCLESQGRHFILRYYLLSCSYSHCSFCHVFFLLLTTGPFFWLFLQKILQYFLLRGKLLGMALV